MMNDATAISTEKEPMISSSETATKLQQQQQQQTSSSNTTMPISSSISEKWSFWQMALVITLVFLCHGWLAELLVISVVNNGYSLGWFFALLTVVGQWIPTLPKRAWKRTDGFRKEHLLVGVAHCLSLGLSNSGGMLVEYNTYALFKSAKVVFVMMISWLLLGIPSSSQELGWGVGLMIGLLMLTGADETASSESKRLNTSPLVGATLLSCGIGASALVSVAQQAALQRRIWIKSKQSLLNFVWQLPNSTPPFSKEDEREALLFWSNLISMFLLGLVCLWNGELVQGVEFFQKIATPKMWAVQITAMILVSGGQRLVLGMNGTYGATASAAVLTFRKVASFITSVLVFPKPFHLFHAVGLFVVVVSAVMIQRSESQATTLRKIKTEEEDKLSIANSV